MREEQLHGKGPQEIIGESICSNGNPKGFPKNWYQLTHLRSATLPRATNYTPIWV